MKKYYRFSPVDDTYLYSFPYALTNTPLSIKKTINKGLQYLPPHNPIYDTDWRINKINEKIKHSCKVLSIIYLK